MEDSQQAKVECNEDAVALQATLTELQDQLAGAHKVIQKKEKEIEVCNQRYLDQKQAVASHEYTAAAAATEITALQEEVKALRSKDARPSMERITSSDADAAEGIANKLKEEIASLQKELAEAKKLSDEHKQSGTDEASKLKEEVASLQKELAEAKKLSDEHMQASGVGHVSEMEDLRSQLQKALQQIDDDRKAAVSSTGKVFSFSHYVLVLKSKWM